MESSVEAGAWINPAAGRITFRRYVEEVWLPSRHVEISTLAAYRSYLDKHFLPFFGDQAIADILPSRVQDWVTGAVRGGLSPSSVVKYYVVIHSVFKRAVRDRVIAMNPCDGTELPKIPPRKSRILTPEEYQRLITHVPERHQLMVQTDIETGLRWGELIALRPRNVDLVRGAVSVEQTIVEVARKYSPTGERMILKAYPKDREFRTVRVSTFLVRRIERHIEELGLGPDDLLFSSTGKAGGNPMSRNTFRTKVWLPAVKASKLDFAVRVHDLRHAHASWLLAGGADLKAVMDRLGHAQIQTTQRYLHTLPDADDKALAAFESIRDRAAR
jgi:integrase